MAAAAYVIYTSGSTGRPKGVVVTHGNAARLFEVTAAGFGFGADEVWSLFHSFAFDFSVWELWGALAYGGRLVVVPYADSRSPEAMHRLLVEQRVTVLSQTPSAFRQLVPVAVAAPDALALRWVVFGGEALEPRSLAPWVARFGTARPGLVNMYGITETTVHVTWRRLTAADVDPGRPASLRSRVGRPLPDLQLYVLDRWGGALPLGVPGELCVGGAGVARGYLGRPALTAARFVPDAFRGGRLYRSGDLARTLPGGDVEYLGRIDAQVKLRGFRIELGEVTAALEAHPRVARALVTLREDAAGKRLVAYLVARPLPAPEGAMGLSAAPPAAELRRFLAARLPEHMVPSAFVTLDALPLTAHGKVDLRALPAPEVLGVAGGAGRAPSGFVEEVLAAAFSQVLERSEVGVEDSFFDLGGDSLLSIRVLGLARERGVEVPLAELFRHPTIAELAPHVRRLAADAAEPVATAPFSLVSPEDRQRLPPGVADAYPLAQLQAGMLFHMQLISEEPPYHNVDSYHLRGPFDPDLFRRAASRVILRHPILRTSFDLRGYHEPLQLVHRTVTESPVVIEDLRALAPAARQATIEQFLADHRSRPLDLARPPLVRFYVHRRTDDEIQFTVVENHAILDGWSLHATMAEIFATAAALEDGEAPPEAPPEVTYRDFVALERQAAASAPSREFWHRKLAGATLLRLPRWPRGARRGLRGPNVTLVLPPALHEGLARLSREAGVPFKSTLLAVHLEALRRLSGEQDVVTGLTTNGRPEVPGGDEVRGLFLNTLPLRLQWPQGGSWRELARRVFDAELELMPHRRYPIAQLHRELQREGHGPLFEVAFNFVHFHVVDPLLGSRLQVVDSVVHDVDNFVLTVTGGRQPGGGRAYLQMAYDADVLAPVQIVHLQRLYLALFAALAADPSAPVGAAEVLAPVERHQLLVEWHAVATPPLAAGDALHRRVAAQAARQPEAVAVVAGEVAVSYGELEARAEVLAARLRALGVGPEVPVGLLLERSPELVVGILGVLKAGGAWLPLDPAYPRPRLALLLADARVPVLVTAGPPPPDLDLGSARVLRLDAPAEDIAVAAAPALHAGSLAYFIYTSGSTGRPKGVACLHRGVLHLLDHCQRQQLLAAGDRASFWTSPSFDVSLYEIFSALTAGAALDVVPPRLRGDGPALVEWLAARRIRAGYLPPFLLADLEAAVTGQGPRPPLCRLLVGVEPIPAARLAAIGNALPGVAIVNAYGPSEASICCAAHWLLPAGTGVTHRASGRTPIGRPVAGHVLYLLDRWRRPVAVGVPGELLVGGEGLARGYYGRPAATAERFLPDPFAVRPGVRLYRTGDLVRWLPDGSLEFVGRVDHQVKVRGFRVEPGEIEARLLEQPQVRDAVVLAHDPATAGAAEADSAARRLIAYVVPAEPPADAALFVEPLRRALQAVLPEHMVPSAFVLLERLPLNANGKLDRAALPVPQVTRSPFVAPRNAVEKVVAGIWQELLGAERVGVDDNFFDLGGHSLHATQVASRLYDAFRVELPLPVLFEARTVAHLAQALQELEPRPGQFETMATVLLRLRDLSPEEKQRMLAAKRGGEGAG